MPRPITAYLLTRPMCSACAEAGPVVGWLTERGVQVTRLDVTTAAGLGEAAWLDAADLELVPVLILLQGDRELCRYVGHMPAPAELRRVLELTREERG